MFNLYHDHDQSLPARIGMPPPNYANRAAIGANDYDTDFPDLKGLLHVEDGTLKVALENHSREALTHLRAPTACRWRSRRAWCLAIWPTCPRGKPCRTRSNPRS